MLNSEISKVLTSIHRGEYDVDKTALPEHGGRSAAWTAYREAEKEQTERLKADALAALGFTDHPKADTLWKLAWEFGHAHGYSDVVYYMDELSELLR